MPLCASLDKSSNRKYVLLFMQVLLDMCEKTVIQPQTLVGSTVSKFSSTSHPRYQQNPMEHHERKAITSKTTFNNDQPRSRKEKDLWLETKLQNFQFLQISPNLSKAHQSSEIVHK